MEARQTLGANAVANGVRILFAVFVAAVLVGAIALTAGNMRTSSGSESTTTVVHPAPGTVLRQDNPVQAAPAERSIYVQGGRPKAVYDQIAAASGQAQGAYYGKARHGGLQQ